MSKWAYVRIALILFVGISSFFVPLEPQAVPPIGWRNLLATFVFCPIALVLVIGLQVINPKSAKIWHRPSWNLGPFNFREPLQLFHLGVYVGLAQGLITLVRIAVSSALFYVEALIPIVMSCGIFIGLHVAMLLFKNKMDHIQ